MATAQYQSTDVHQLLLRQPNAPRHVACSASRARRSTWSTGPDIGSDHLSWDMGSDDCGH